MTQSTLRPELPSLDGAEFNPEVFLRGEVVKGKIPVPGNGHVEIDVRPLAIIRRWPDGSRTVQVGGHARLFGPPIDWRRWTEKYDRKQDDAGYGKWKLASPWPLPVKALRWHPLGPRQAALQKLAALGKRKKKLEEELKVERKKYGPMREARLSVLEDVIASIKMEILMIGAEEETRKKFARERSKQKRPLKALRKKSRKPKPEEQQLPATDGEQQGGGKKGKKKGGGKKKNKGGDGGEQGGNKDKGNQGKGKRRRGGK